MEQIRAEAKGGSKVMQGEVRSGRVPTAQPSSCIEAETRMRR